MATDIPASYDQPTPSQKKLDSALLLSLAGLTVIPVHSETKVPVGKWSDWENDQSVEHITQHYEQHPDHDIAFITDSNLIVFDVDSPEAVAALYRLEEIHGVEPSVVVKTRKGEHHYFQRPEDVFAKQDSHSTTEHPERIDIKTDRSLVIAAGSKNKSYVKLDATHRSEWNPVTQAFVDAVFQHNGREAPRPPAPKPAAARDDVPPIFGAELTGTQNLLSHISPKNYKVWVDVGMAIWHETQGSDVGYELWNHWSQGSGNYCGAVQTRYKWNSFGHGTHAPLTMGTLIHYAREGGWTDGFEVCETVVVNANQSTPPQSQETEILPANPSGTEGAPAECTESINPLARYSLRDSVEELEAQAVEEKMILGSTMVYGQLGVVFAAPNTGKTLIMLHLITTDIRNGVLDPSKVYYLNMDDNTRGLLQKVKVAQEFGFHMLADGHAGFGLSNFRELIEHQIATGHARGTVLVLDTLTKFVDTMSKQQTREFTALMRRFALKGGTVIALAHTNKKLGEDGKAVFAGVGDVVNDFDSAYILQAIDDQSSLQIKTVQFRNIKRRGNNVLSDCYSYAQVDQIDYLDLLLSMQKVDPQAVETMQAQSELAKDAEVIAGVLGCIQDGFTTRMKLAIEVATRVDISRNRALAALDKYCGEDPMVHQWRFTVRDRGAKVYEPLVGATPPGSLPGFQDSSSPDSPPESVPAT